MFPLLLLAKTYWKPLSILGAFMVTFYAGYHVRGAFDEVAANRLLQAQVEETKKAQLALHEASEQLEDTLAKERKRDAGLKKQWRKAHAKDHTVCDLPVDGIRVLKDATAKD